jgi:hypothetical protein
MIEWTGNLPMASANSRIQSRKPRELFQMTSAPLKPDMRAETLVQSHERAGYGRLAPPILLPAEPFLDVSGEDIRKF